MLYQGSLRAFLIFGCLAFGSGSGVPDAAFCVSVSEPSGSVPEASGRLISVDGVWDGRSGTDGVIRFENVPDGVYDVEVRAQGFVNWAKRAVVHRATTQTDIEATISLMPFTCGYEDAVAYRGRKLFASGAASGRVLDEDSRKGVRRVRVSVRRVDGKGEVASAISAKDGSFALPVLEPGRYSIHALKDGYRESQIEVIVPRGNETVIELNMDLQGHMHLCQ